MKTSNARVLTGMAGFALGLVLVLSLIMLAAVGALLGFATSEYRSARRNVYAVEAFHLAEEGIARGVAAAYEKRKSEESWTGDMPDITTMTTETLRDPAVRGRSLRVTTKVGATKATIYSLARLETTSGTVQRAIRVEYEVPQISGTADRSGPAIGGNYMKLGFNGNQNLGNHYAAFRSSLGKPVWNPKGFYDSVRYPDLWTTDKDGNLVTNCFDSFRVVSSSTDKWAKCDIGSSHIYGHVASATDVTWARETTAPDKPAAWVGETRSPTEMLSDSEKPYSTWVEVPDQATYGTKIDYGNENTLIDGKCIEQGFTTMDTSWLDVPTPPTIDPSTGGVTDSGEYSIPVGTVPTRLGNDKGNGNFDNVNYNGGGTITWPASGEGSAYFVANNFDITHKSTLVINGPVTVLVTGDCKFSQNGDADIVFGPKGSLTFIHTGTHATLDYARAKQYTPVRTEGGVIAPPENQVAALAAATDNYTSGKLKFDCSNSGDFVMHVNESNALMTAEIIAPKMTVRLHASTNKQSTFIGRVIANEVETTNGFDFFYDLDSGSNDDDDTKDGWPLLSWRQIVPSAVPAPAS